MDIKSIIGTVSICLAIITSTPSMASILTDQASIGSIQGGYSGVVVQTFTPTQDNIAGVDAFLTGTGSFDANVTLNLWSELRVDSPVFSMTLNDVPRGTLMEFRWDAVEINPANIYYLEFSNSGFLAMGALIPGPYSDGAVIEGGGNLFNGGADLYFSTYYDDTFVSSVPVPAAAWLFGSGLLGLVGVARRKNA